MTSAAVHFAVTLAFAVTAQSPATAPTTTAPPSCELVPGVSADVLARGSASKRVSAKGGDVSVDGGPHVNLGKSVRALFAVDTKSASGAVLRVLALDDARAQVLDVSGAVKQLWKEPASAAALSSTRVVTALKKSRDTGCRGSACTTVITVRDAETGKALSSLEVAVTINELAFSPDEKLVVASDDAYGLLVWKLDGDKLVEQRELLWTRERILNKGPYTSIAFGPGVVAANTWDSLAIWDLSSGKRVELSSPLSPPLTSSPVAFCGDSFFTGAYSKDGVERISLSGGKPPAHVELPARIELAGKPRSLRCEKDALLVVVNGAVWRCSLR